ncbi:type IX secretion system outer membrane channel protein PorV [Avrilella dinanensis]|uniref:type IX secretion system outer membrane channel protein PorV n=1 Tax=Avrilella dinanensis TaxID=2008672 RepID=UPI00240935BC|nr:type IX secretion system outer membrane channel protein PorV [Avrilella dinanensis]
MRKLTILAITAFAAQATFAQTPVSEYKQKMSRAITTGVPFLLISADARAAGMGDIGTASSPDAFSQQYNPAKYVFSKQQQGFSISYTPYMAKLATDISLAQLNYFNKFNDRSAFAASVRYFGMGEIQKTNEIGDPIGTEEPNEFAIDVSYGLKLSDHFSGAVAARYISSNLVSSEERETSANSVAVDIAGFYESEEMQFDGFDGKIRAGFNLQNLGPKISYAEGQEDFLPSNLRLGGGFDFILDEHNKIATHIELTKLLVPSRQVPEDLNNDGVITPDEVSANNRKYNETSWTSGLFKSFGDAPDGFGEELREFTWALGAEYWYQDSFAFRLGYFNEAEDKGARRFATLGAGFKYNIINIDVSYLFDMGGNTNPLDSTLRFSLTFNFGQKYY